MALKWTASASRPTPSSTPLLASDQGAEGPRRSGSCPPTSLVVGDNVVAVEVHQVNATSSDDVFGMSLSAIRYTTNVITQNFAVPLVLNEVLAQNLSLTNLGLLTADYVELYNPSTNTVDLSDLSLSNDPNDPRKWVFPTNSIITPLGLKVVFCSSDAAPASSTNTGFALRPQGDTVYASSTVRPTAARCWTASASVCRRPTSPLAASPTAPATGP